MKILHILNELKFSGAEIMYVDAAPEFQKLGCELCVANTAQNLGEFAQSFREAGYDVYHFPYPKGFIARCRYYKRMIEFVKKECIDVIHIHSSGMKWGMAFVARIAGIKSIYTVHSCFYNPPLTRPYQIWLRWSAAHLFGCRMQSISDSVFKNELGRYHNKTTLVYNWFGNQRFTPPQLDEKDLIRKRLGISSEATVIISVGGCSHVKRHEDIIKILPQLVKDYPDTIYLHLGEGSTTVQEKQLAKQLHVENHIRFLGNQKEVRDFLIAADFYLMTSKFEGISITTIEALACKTPAILYDVDGLRDFNSEMQCSILVKENPKEISEAITRLKSDRELRNKIVENGYKYIMSKFYLPDNAKQIFDLYNNRHP